MTYLSKTVFNWILKKENKSKMKNMIENIGLRWRGSGKLRCRHINFHLIIDDLLLGLIL